MSVLKNIKLFIALSFLFLFFNSNFVLADGVNSRAFLNGESYYLLKENGELWAVGENNNGQFGLGDEKYIEIPMLIAENVQDVKVINVDNINILKNDGSLWGTHYYSVKDTPYVFTIILDDAKEIEKGYALRNDGSFWHVYGYNYDTKKNVCKRIADDVETFAIVSCVYEAGFVVKSDGTLWGFGEDFQGCFGNIQDKKGFKEPNKFMDDVLDIKTSGSRIVALKKDNTLWGWNINTGREYGDESPVFPVELFIDDVVDFEVSRDTVLAIKSDNTLWSWGTNKYGLLGIGKDVKETSVPVKVMDDVDEIKTCGGDVAYALKLDGSLWGWGNNTNRNIKKNKALLVDADSSDSTDNSKRLRKKMIFYDYKLSTPKKIMENVTDFYVGVDWRYSSNDEYRYFDFQGNYKMIALTEDGKVWIRGTPFGSGDPKEIYFGEDYEEKKEEIEQSVYILEEERPSIMYPILSFLIRDARSAKVILDSFSEFVSDAKAERYEADYGGKVE